MSVTFNCTFEETSSLFSADFGVIQEVMPDSIDVYEGEYNVTPTVGGQVLQTAEKLMVDDVTIKEIPFFETSNVSGGKTVYIGREIE